MPLEFTRYHCFVRWFSATHKALWLRKSRISRLQENILQISVTILSSGCCFRLFCRHSLIAYTCFLSFAYGKKIFIHCLGRIFTRNVEVVISSTASASTNKKRKRSLTIFFNFCGSVTCLFLHFIILRRQKPIHSLLLCYLLRSNLLFQTTLCLIFFRY